MNNVEYEPGERFSVTLTRSDSGVPWGFRLQGGVDFTTPLSVQVVQPNSVAEQYGLQSGDGIETINNQSAAVLTHEDAKREIIRSGNEIAFIIVRGAVRIWKPLVTPMSELKPAQLNLVHSAIGDQYVPVQKTSLAKPEQAAAPHIGSSHNRAARPFGAQADTPNKQASASVVHSQFNSPIGLYSHDNIAQTYAMQTVGISDQVQSLDISDRGVGTRMSGGTYQVMDNTQGDDAQTTDPNTDPQSVGPHSPTTNTQHDDTQFVASHTNDVPSHGPAEGETESSESCHGSATAQQSRSFYKVESELQESDSMASSGGGPGGFRSVRPPEPKPPGQKSNKPALSHCYACDMLITGMFVKAAGQPYHVQCLKCTTCNMNLKQKGFIVIEGKLYCDDHARRAAKAPGSNMVAVPTFQ